MPSAATTTRVATRSAGTVGAGVSVGPDVGRGVRDGSAVGGRVTIVGVSDGSGPASTGAV